jgi:hypothetical protein
MACGGACHSKSPPRRILLLAAAVTATAVAVTGCSIGDDGPRTSQTRDVPTFTRIDNADSVDVQVHVGEPQRVRVRAGEEVIDDLRTSVRDGTLHITFDHHGFGDSDPVVEASVPRLSGIDASGSGDVTADGIEAGAFDVRSDGSADISLQGTAGRLRVDMDGSGDANLGDLSARIAKVAVGGSGDADVRAGDRLDVRVDGSGDVEYHGDPSVTKRLDGSGDLSQGD